mgnify:FL=1
MLFLCNQRMLIDLSGKNALVTGAGRGIGKACALVLAKSGANLIINDRKESPDLGQTKKEIINENVSCIAITADVSSRAECEKLIKEIQRENISIDILISNPALSIREDFLKQLPNDFEKIIQTTLISGFYVSQLVAQTMVSKGTKGKMLFISSVHAEMPIAQSAAYGCAKAGLNHLVRTISVELSHHRINVNAIQPGWIDTPGEYESFKEQTIQKEASKLPWGRLGSADEIAQAACFLVSDKSDYITGSILTVDGGFRYKDFRTKIHQES